jgi:molybdenum cofactor cytidylyltransferase
MTVGAILLAAGTGSRMGSNKLLAPLGGKPLVRHAADAIVSAGLPLVAVTSDSEVDAALASTGATFVSAGGGPPAIGRSIALGIAALAQDWTAALVCLGDMPFIRPETLHAIADAAATGRVVVPLRAGRRGNPLAWGKAFWPQLHVLSEDQGARVLLAGLTDQMIPLDIEDDGILRDIDTVEDLETAQARAGRFSAGGGGVP